MGMTGTRPRTNIGFLKKVGTSDFITNGTFDADTDWNKEAGWDINVSTAGKAHCDGTQATLSSIYQDAGFQIGHMYRLQSTLSARSAGGYYHYCGGAIAGRSDRHLTDGTYTDDLVCAGNSITYLMGDSAFTGDLDDYTAFHVLLS